MQTLCNVTGSKRSIFSMVSRSSNNAWLELVGQSGRNDYLELQTSSSSYVPALLLLLPEHRCSSSMGKSSVIDIEFIMNYLEFVFPTIFPFYRPALSETGRSWLLLLLGRSKIAYHSALRLSCYFFTIALTKHTGCKQMRWKEVEEQANKCFRWIWVLACQDMRLGRPSHVIYFAFDT
jgi:hypothetical protein